MKTIIVLILFVSSSFVVAQQTPSNIAVFDPDNPNLANDYRPSPDRLEVLNEYLNSEAKNNQPTNDLDSSELDKLILDGLFAEIVSNPRIAQARLDFSDIQLEKTSEILLDLQKQSSALSNSKTESLCNRLSMENSPTREQLSQQYSYVEDEYADTNSQLLADYQESITKIREQLGAANSEIFDLYLSNKRSEVTSWKIVGMPEVLFALGSTENILNQLCKS